MNKLTKGEHTYEQAFKNVAAWELKNLARWLIFHSVFRTWHFINSISFASIWCLTCVNRKTLITCRQWRWRPQEGARKYRFLVIKIFAKIFLTLHTEKHLVNFLSVKASWQNCCQMHQQACVCVCALCNTTKHWEKPSVPPSPKYWEKYKNE
jgi:hypothetical protein